MTISTHCLLCGAPHPENGLCIHCHADLPWLPAHHCLRCSLPLSPSQTQTYCGSCLQKSFYFDQCRAVFSYLPPIDFLVSRFKYHGDFATGRLLSLYFQKHFSSFELRQSTQYLPMPLHPKRLKERGFNQAMLLVNNFIDKNSLILTACDRTFYTLRQSGLSAQERRKNLKGVFAYHPQQSRQERIVIIDDVVTTGATVNELAYTLKEQGVSQVDVWCLARTPSPK